MIVEKIFPTPIVFSHIEREFTDTEKDLFIKISGDRIHNMSNTRSRSSSVLDCEEMLDIRNFIQSKLDWYVSNILVTPKEDNVSLRITQSWMNFTNPGQHHHKHVHNNSYVSGVFYINAIEEIDKILFYDKKFDSMIQPNQSEFNEFNSPARFFPVSTGKLVLFPSWVPHSVPGTENMGVRVSLSFNTFISGKFGEEGESTYLEI